MGPKYLNLCGIPTSTRGLSRQPLLMLTTAALGRRVLHSLPRHKATGLGFLAILLTFFGQTRWSAQQSNKRLSVTLATCGRSEVSASGVDGSRLSDQGTLHPSAPIDFGLGIWSVALG